MTKAENQMVSTSCWNKAKADELIFILLARDIAVPETIRFWVDQRIELEKNVRSDKQIQDALKLADEIENDQIFTCVS